MLELGIAQQPDDVRPRALLLAGLRDSAENLLRKLTSRRNAPATTLSDYAATLHATAAPDDALKLSMALAAADRALDLQPELPEALFNRAIILDALALRGETAFACRKYLEVDSSSKWAEEIRARLRKIDSEQPRTAASRDIGRDLERAAEAGDELFINDVATTYPKEARSWSNFYLTQWAERFLEKDRDGAASMLMLCRVIGRALEARGDSLLADAVRAIEASAGSREHLARAHVAYERGRRANQWHESERALRSLEQARKGFSEHGSPMALSARYYIAITLRQKNSPALLRAFEAARKRFSEHGSPIAISAHLSKAVAADERVSTKILRDLASNAPARYRVLHGEVQLLLASQGSHTSALQSIRSATATFEALGEKQKLVTARERTARLLARSGDMNSAWRMRHAAMTSAAEMGNDLGLIGSVHAAARDAISDARWDVAYALLNVVAGESHRHDPLREEAIVWRALAAYRAGIPRTAATALAKARATNIGRMICGWSRHCSPKTRKRPFPS